MTDYERGYNDGWNAALDETERILREICDQYNIAIDAPETAAE